MNVEVDDHGLCLGDPLEVDCRIFCSFLVLGLSKDEKGRQVAAVVGQISGLERSLCGSSTVDQNFWRRLSCVICAVVGVVVVECGIIALVIVVEAVGKAAPAPKLELDGAESVLMDSAPSSKIC